MNNMFKSTYAKGLTAVTLLTASFFSNSVWATDDKKVDTKTELEQDEKQAKEKLKEIKSRSRYKKVTLSEDKAYYTIKGYEELGPNPVDGETFYIKYNKKKYEGENDKVTHSSKDYDWEDHHDVHYRIKNWNKRDGFYLAYSFVSTSGDNLYDPLVDQEDAFDRHFSYRAQLLSLFVESPGLNSRRIHGLYASNAWGINFYNGDNWSLDIYKQTDTKKVEGLEQIQNRNIGRRAGVRATGYFDNSQLQFIYSPYSDGDAANHGIEASFSYTHYLQLRNWNLYASVGAQFQSKEIVDFATPDLTVDQDRVNTAAEIGFEYALSKHWVLGAFHSYSDIASQTSLIEESQVGNRSGLLLTFVF